MKPCEKVGYATKHEAKAAKRDCQRLAADGVSWRQESRIYRCSCGSWHLSSLPHHSYTEASNA